MTIQQRYDFYKEIHSGEKPHYAVCTIQWKDDKSICEHIIIALDEYNINTKDDEKIFFYVGGVNDFIKLFDDNNEDFIVLELTEFTNDLI